MSYVLCLTFCLQANTLFSDPDPTTITNIKLYLNILFIIVVPIVGHIDFIFKLTGGYALK